MKRKNAFTLIEIVVAMVIMAMLTLGAGALLAGGQRNWNKLYDRVNSDSAVEGFLVQRVFDSICRKSSLRKCVIGDEQSYLELYYWDEASTAEIPENYARMYLLDSEVYVEHGKLWPGTWHVNWWIWPDRLVVARDVESLVFETQDRAVRMYLTYQDDSVLPVVSSAVRHNK